MFISMRKSFFGKKGQGTAEYAILIGLVIGAIVVMQVYIKRGLQAKMKDSTDLITTQGGDIANVGTLADTEQYEPYYLTREQQQTTSREKTEKKVAVGGEATTSTGKTTEQKSVVIYGYDTNSENPPTTP